MLRDLRLAARMLLQAKGWTAVVLVCLALGIGANTALFGAINGLLLRKLPVRDPDSLVRLRYAGPNQVRTDVLSYGFMAPDDRGRPVEPVFSYPMYRQFVADNRTMSDVFAGAPFGRVNLVVNGRAEVASAFISSGNYYQALGVAARIGRTIARDAADFLVASRDGSPEAGRHRGAGAGQPGWRLSAHRAGRVCILSIVAAAGGAGAVVVAGPFAGPGPAGGLRQPRRLRRERDGHPRRHGAERRRGPRAPDRVRQCRQPAALARGRAAAGALRTPGARRHARETGPAASNGEPSARCRRRHARRLRRDVGTTAAARGARAGLPARLAPPGVRHHGHHADRHRVR